MEKKKRNLLTGPEKNCNYEEYPGRSRRKEEALEKGAKRKKRSRLLI